MFFENKWSNFFSLVGYLSLLLWMCILMHKQLYLQQNKVGEVKKKVTLSILRKLRLKEHKCFISQVFTNNKISQTIFSSQSAILDN